MTGFAKRRDLLLTRSLDHSHDSFVDAGARLTFSTDNEAEQADTIVCQQ